jgi:hypothetical protein
MGSDRERDRVDAERFRALVQSIDVSSVKIISQQASSQDRVENVRAFVELADTLRGA